MKKTFLVISVLLKAEFRCSVCRAGTPKQLKLSYVELKTCKPSLDLFLGDEEFKAASHKTYKIKCDGGCW